MEKLKTVIILSEERFRKEYRNVVGKVDCVRIELEVPSFQECFSDEAMEEISSFDPQILLIDLPKEQSDAVRVLARLHHQFLNIPILAAGDVYDSSFLIEAMRLGVKEFLPRPLNAENLREALQRFYKSAFAEAVDKAPATIFSFFSSKGGSGSTTIATNLAVSLSKLSKKKVLVVDLDMQLGDVAGFFGIKENRYLVRDGSDKPLLDPKAISRATLTHQKTGIDILSVDNGYSRKTLPTIGEIKHLLNFLQADYDYILLDTSNRIDDNAVAALDASHLVFLISKCNFPALRNAQKVLHVFDKLGYSANKVRIIINRYSKTEEIGLKDVEKALKFKVFWSIPSDFKSIIQSIQWGEPLTLRSQSTPLARSFYEMSAQVLGIQPEQRPKPPGGRLMIRAKDSATKSLPLTTLDLLKS